MHFEIGMDFGIHLGPNYVPRGVGVTAQTKSLTAIGLGCVLILHYFSLKLLKCPTSTTDPTRSTDILATTKKSV